MNMKTLKTSCAQGELYLTVVSLVPPEFTSVTSGHLIVGHSESGHHHVIRDGVTMHDSEPINPCVCYLRVSDDYDGQAALEHLKTSGYVHPTIRLEPGQIVRVHRARQGDIQAWRRADD